MDINKINSAISQGNYALTLTKTAHKQIDSAENLSSAAGLLGLLISSFVQKSANDVAKRAEEAVLEFTETLSEIGGFDDIYMSADAESRLDDVLFTSARNSMTANYSAIRIRTEDAIKAIENAIEKLKKMKTEMENSL